MFNFAVLADLNCESCLRLLNVARLAVLLIAPASVCLCSFDRSSDLLSSYKLTWLALGDDHADPSRGGEQATALGRL